MHDQMTGADSRGLKSSATIFDTLAHGLGWFSIGLGVAEIAAPGALARAVGLEGKESLIRAYGAREIGAGTLALADVGAPAIWNRVGGDLLDLGTLAIGYRNATDDKKRGAAIAIATVAAVTLVDIVVASGLMRDRKQDRGKTQEYKDAAVPHPNARTSMPVLEPA